jgi:hypothetical protein
MKPERSCTWDATATIFSNSSSVASLIPLSFQECEYGLRVAFVFLLASWYQASRSMQSSQPFVFGIRVNFETAIRKG